MSAPLSVPSELPQWRDLGDRRLPLRGVQGGAGTDAHLAVTLTVRADDGVAIVSFAGRGGDPVRSEDRAAVLASIRSSPTVLDVATTMLVEPEKLVELLRSLIRDGGIGNSCVVAGRLTARTMLLRLGLGTEAAVFATMADAMQAWRLAAEGYGAGWSPLPGEAHRLHGREHGTSDRV